jgi:ankyrin repeat protein
MLASMKQHTEAVDLLLAAGADVDMVNLDGKRARDYLHEYS